MKIREFIKSSAAPFIFALFSLLITGFVFSNIGVLEAGNPPGNNGTIKIDDVPFDDHPNNEPHVSCKFEVDFYGYDRGELYSYLTFEAQPPTGRSLLLNDIIFIGEDDAGGGTDLDAHREYDLSQKLIEYDPHPQQGYHIYLTINADGSQGADVKHKVFWVESCPEPEPTNTPTPTPKEPVTHPVPPTATPTPEPTSTLSPTPEIIPSVTPTPEPEVKIESEPSPTPTNTPAPTPTVTPVQELEPTATPTPAPTNTPEPGSEPTATPTPGGQVQGNEDPTPTPEPSGQILGAGPFAPTGRFENILLMTGGVLFAVGLYGYFITSNRNKKGNK